MYNPESLLEGLKEKLILILNKNEGQEKQIIQLQNEIENLKKTIINLQNKIEETNKENYKLKLSHSLEKVNDKGEIKRKINEMVREIDKCIAYLNK